MSTRRTLITSTALVAVALVAVKVFITGRPAAVKAEEPPAEVRLRGAVRDFRSSHQDFDLSSTTGHCALNVAPELGATGRPEHLGTGLQVTEQWYDMDRNPIMPYFDEPGLPGGHFDVDIYDAYTDKARYHKHQYDDEYDVTYIDVINDGRLLFRPVVQPSTYPNSLRMEFLNPHHSSGTYTIEAGGILHTGDSQEGFELVFDPATLTQCRVDFATLMDMKRTSPGDSQKDVADRDDSFAIRMWDVSSGNLVYEICVYHHTSDTEPFTIETSGGTHKGEDSCGDPIEDDLGRFSGACNGGVTDTASFAQWFRDALGVNLSASHTITLKRNGDGVYEYLTDKFFPIDDRLFGNEDHTHNNFFTYAISATFTYNACTDQFF
ncbi:MAG: hypothetical protein ACYTJ0_02820, partial [Planctomycetota bacterium]